MARRRDIEAKLRLGVGRLRGIGGLVSAVLSASGAERASLGSRAGWDVAFTTIRQRNPFHDGSPPRLTVSTVPSRELAVAHRSLVDLLGAYPDLPSHPRLSGCVDEATVEWLVGTEFGHAALSVHRKGVRAFVGIRDLAARAGLDLSTLLDPLAVARLVGSRPPRPDAAGRRVPWSWRATSAYALADPVRDVVAMAHGRARVDGADLPVVVLDAFASEVRRASHATGIRLPRGRAWHRDPATAAAMDAAAREWCRLHAAWKVDGDGCDPWRTAFVRSVESGTEVYVMAADGTVTRHEVAGAVLDPWTREGLGAAVRAATVTPALPCDGGPPNGYLASGEVFGHGFRHADDPDGTKAQVCGELAAAVDHMPRGRRMAFAYAVRALAEGMAHAAAIAFEERADPDVMALAEHAMAAYDNTKREGKGRTSLLGLRVNALALACQHGDRRAVLAAARRVPHLVRVAGCHGYWRGASDLLSSGAGDNAALARLAADHAGWPAGKSVARAMRAAVAAPGMSPGQDLAMVVAEVAATLAAAEPSRPAPTAAEAASVASALSTLGISPPRADPLAAIAVVRGLAGMPHASGPDEAACLVYDLWEWFGAQAGRVGLDHGGAVALREAALLPVGRTGAALARISGDWHRVVGGMVRERGTLLGILLAEERACIRGGRGGVGPEDFPGPFAGPFRVGDVEVVPLRDFAAIDAEGEVQSSCVASYGEDARVGRLAILSLRSAAGRSTAGHRFHVDGGRLSWRLQEHSGDQSRGHARSAPPGTHVDALERVTDMMSCDLEPCVVGWRVSLVEARRLHRALEGAVGEHALGEAGRVRLRDLDLAHLRPFLPRDAAAMDASTLAVHGACMGAGRRAAIAALRGRLGVGVPRPVAE